MLSPSNSAVSHFVSVLASESSCGPLFGLITWNPKVDYLIDPIPHHYIRSPRVGAGAAIIAVYYVLLIPVLVTYLRLFYNVAWNPGFLPRGAPSIEDQDDNGSRSSNRRHRKHRRRRNSRSRGRTTEKTDRNDMDPDVEGGLDYAAEGKAYPLNTGGLESFYTKDVFVCQPDGRPSYCSTCCQFKTDRAHHCREVDRCVRKMDHFCPWCVPPSLCYCEQALTIDRVGGVVSETSFKFFIQFVSYTFIFCAFALIVCAVFTAELKKDEGRANPHWAVGIGL